MHIQIETPVNNTIRSYTDKQISIGTHFYQESLIVCTESLLTEWPVQSIKALNEDNIKPLLHLNPEVIIIGHQESGEYPSVRVIEFLSKKRVGIECMSIGSACRTFNVLLSEQRRVVLGIIFRV